MNTCSNHRHEPFAWRWRHRTRAHLPVVADGGQRGAQIGQVVGMHDVAPVAVQPERKWMPEDPLVRRGEVRHLAVGVDDGEQVEAALHERAQAFLALPQGELDELALGDVTEVPDQAPDVRIAEQVEGDDLGPHPGAVGAPDTGLGDAGLVGRLEQPGQVLAEAREVVGMDQVETVIAQEVGGRPARDRLDRARREDDGSRLVGDHDHVARPAHHREQEVVQRFERVGVTDVREPAGDGGGKLGPVRHGHTRSSAAGGPVLSGKSARCAPSAVRHEPAPGQETSCHAEWS